ncbi:legumain-like [Oppia nitens]|uniref:legumain-like n=1 Tax=Oppia nitens TaxID=1686743 RepID=UPI0023D993D8|nr:legumain-like [Oppia nitens]
MVNRLQVGHQWQSTVSVDNLNKSNNNDNRTQQFMVMFPSLPTINYRQSPKLYLTEFLCLMASILSLCLLLLVVCILPVQPVLQSNSTPTHTHTTTATNGTNWIVLVAGSAGIANYGDQANVYRAYHAARAHGVPDKNIIVMYTDDIAYNKQNPTPGIVINEPNGPDVYNGVPKDYIGDDVNPITFLALLRGDRTLERNHKKVVKSGPNDNIFIYFIDHGSPDEVRFPHAKLFGAELNAALRDLYDRKLFNKLVFYLESCESGSMFEKYLPNNINIYATTAANPKEPSMFMYCDDKIRPFCLGSYYSNSWLDNWEHMDIYTETLQQQYDYIRSHTNKSHVMQYGDLSIAKLPVSYFLAGPK